MEAVILATQEKALSASAKEAKVYHQTGSQVQTV